MTAVAQPRSLGFPIDFRALVDLPALEAGPEVLVVDANPLFRKAVRSVLEGGGYTVVLAATADEALRAVATRRPDAMVIDYGLPGQGGVRLVQRLRTLPDLANLPCLLLSGSDDREDEVRAFEAGADDFIIKSDGFSVLRHRLRARLRRRVSEDDLRREVEARHQRELAAERERLQAEIAQRDETIRQQQEAMVRASQQAASLMHSMSAELRTPLNAVVGFADLLGRELFGPLGQRQKEHVRHIQRAGRQLQHLLGELLELSRFDAGLVELVREPTSLPLLAEAVGGVARPMAAERGVELSIAVPRDLPLVPVDRTRLRQALYNLVASGVRVAASGGAVEVIATRDGLGHVEFSVCCRQGAVPPDHGSGTDESATGLGLAVARRIAEMHGGSLAASGPHPSGQPGVIWQLRIPLTLPAPPVAVSAVQS